MKMKGHILSCCLIAIFANGAQAMEPVEPGKAGFVPGRLDRVDQVVMEAIDDGEIAGAVALIARNGQIVYHKSFGYADIDSETPMRNDSIFRIASMTKAITSVAVMMLYERGYFQLNDPVSRFIPEFGNPTVVVVNEEGEITGTRPATREIRIVDLLTHSAGIGYVFMPSHVQKVYLEAGIIDGLTASAAVLGPTIRKLAGLPLLFDPG